MSIKHVEKLRGVDARLVEVVELAASICPIDIYVIEGLRTKARQTELVKAGKSKTMKSYHLTGKAVDLWDGRSWEKMDFAPIIRAMEQAAKQLGVRLTGGYTWGWDY
ncbi:UNVERIFIED_CONTAM: hypothetical protein RF648_18480, partial [Kocuria sp. CPCC 205274]